MLKKQLVRVARWIRNRLKDLFYGVGNRHLDVGRVIATFSLLGIFNASIWNMHLGKEINLQDLGLGLAAVLTALVAYVVYDRKNNVTK